MKAKKGFVAVLVGLHDDEDPHKLKIPISYLHHPSLKSLLDKAHDLYGYQASGPLRLPCSLEDFQQVRAMIEPQRGYNGVRRTMSQCDHNRLHRSLSFTGCCAVEGDD